MTSASTSTSVPPDFPSQWTQIGDDKLTADIVQNGLVAVADDLWVTAACVDRLVEDVSLQRTLLEIGISRTDSAIRRSKVAAEELSGDHSESSVATSEDKRRHDALVSYFEDEPADAQLCQMRNLLLGRLDRLNTFVEVCKELPLMENTAEKDNVDEEWEDDPWSETAGGTQRAT